MKIGYWAAICGVSAVLGGWCFITVFTNPILLWRVLGAIGTGVCLFGFGVSYFEILLRLVDLR